MVDRENELPGLPGRVDPDPLAYLPVPLAIKQEAVILLQPDRRRRLAVRARGADPFAVQIDVDPRKCRDLRRHASLDRDGEDIRGLSLPRDVAHHPVAHVYLRAGLQVLHCRPGARLVRLRDLEDPDRTVTGRLARLVDLRRRQVEFRPPGDLVPGLAEVDPVTVLLDGNHGPL